MIQILELTDKNFSGLVVKNLPAMQETFRRHGFNHWVGKMSWRRKWQPIPVFLPGESHGQRSLVDYSVWGLKRVRHDLGTTDENFKVTVITVLIHRKKTN